MTDGYSVINFTYYDPRNSIFKAGKNDREFVKIYWCNNFENCDAYKRKKCFMCNGLWGENCPYGYIRKETGYTKAARSCGKLIRKTKDMHQNCAYAVKELKFICRIGDYVFLNLPWLDNYSNPIFKGDLVSGKLLPLSKFTPEAAVALIKFVPRTLFGNEPIADYQKKYVPVFCNQLKRYMPDMYEKVKEIYPEIEERIESIDYRDKLAKVHTLLPGEVKVGSHFFKWDGEYLIGKANYLYFSSMKDEEMRIIPNEDTFVTIWDNETVTEDTEFRDE